MKLKTLALASMLAIAATSVHAAPIQWTTASGGNDHWYDFIAIPAGTAGWTWGEAFNLANASVHNGMQGYLATMTSAAENQFASSLAGSPGAWPEAWLGGSDADQEGVWQWVNGPEAGQSFIYANWAGGEPNNSGGGEDYLHTNHANQAGHTWNDYGGPGTGATVRFRYIVEYSVPEPATLSLMGLALAGLAAARRRKQ